MTSNKQTFKPLLDGYLKEHAELISDISLLQNGDSSGMVLMDKRSDGRILPEGERITALLNEKVYELSALVSRIDDFCQNFGLENPLK